ncbi:lytic murein transglycosylase B [Thiolapillus brandeum]|uniref:Membrane-bound lytic murein transglycosylase n=1 Tax=Thiolapillus brandeum TaxID=1076588 RepID=A0A7U6JG10_9GAMM|nr:lytic murein transglycosylase B [Thiolapillus brandeum]BAO43206.1 membrane-bound lytic murein transglycosylase [Thiolapillus brandeum]
MTMRILVLLLFCLPTLVLGDSRVNAFIDHMSKTQGFDAAELRKVLNKAQKRQDIIDRMNKPAEHTLNWGQYRRIFLQDKRIDQGAEFWKRNEETLNRAEQTYGVPPQFVVAIIGVETFYGRIAGKDRVLDALYTLAFHYPKRSKFFTAELEKYLILTRDEGLDPTLPKGSYAGAMGLGQFMPSSYLAYAVDFDGDGRRDIWNNEADAIGSVANYFARHGWKAGLPVTIPVSGVNKTHGKFIDAGLKPRFTLGQLRQAGLSMDPALGDDLDTALIKLVTEKGPEYWAGLNNFYVITRYNHSELYAMAVYQLGERIREIHQY